MTDNAVNRSLRGCGRSYPHVYAEDVNVYQKKMKGNVILSKSQ